MNPQKLTWRKGAAKLVAELQARFEAHNEFVRNRNDRRYAMHLEVERHRESCNAAARALESWRRHPSGLSVSAEERQAQMVIHQEGLDDAIQRLEAFDTATATAAPPHDAELYTSVMGAARKLGVIDADRATVTITTR